MKQNNTPQADDQPITRSILKEELKRASEENGLLIADALQLIARMFEEQERKVNIRFERMETKIEEINLQLKRMDCRSTRAESKLDNHEIRIKRLEKRTLVKQASL